MTDLARLAAFVAAEGSTALDWRHKALGSLSPGTTVASVRESGLPWSALGSPVLTVDRSAVAQNVVAMADWSAARGLRLAPHGKTTMAPALWLAQLRAGAWGITVATAAQLRAARAFGVDRIVLANELVGSVDLRWLADELAAHAACEVLCWVDSVAAIERIEAAVGSPVRPLDVAVEVGAPGGRTGLRDLAAVRVVADRVRSSTACRLAGVSGYEGAVPGVAPTEAGLAAVDAFLAGIVAAHEALLDAYEVERPVVTAGGSGYFDRVADALGPLGGDPGRPVDVVLRSGAYVVHDDVHYAAETPSTRGSGPDLRAAIHVWAQVTSRPEPDLVILDAGKRDLPYDLGLPVPLAGHRGEQAVDVRGATVLRLNDQHAYVSVPTDCDLAVGDVVRLGLSHPCTAFDKWRAIPVITSVDDPDPRVVDVLLTYF